MGLNDRLGQSFGSLCLSIVLQVLKLVQVVTRYRLGCLQTIADNLDFVIESDDADFALTRPIRHIVDL